MSDSDDRTRSQLTALFQKSDDVVARTTKLEVEVDNLKELTKETQKLTAELKLANNKAHLYLFGDPATGHKGVLTVQSDQGATISKHENILVKVGIGIAVTVALLKYLGYWDKLLG